MNQGPVAEMPKHIELEYDDLIVSHYGATEGLTQKEIVAPPLKYSEVAWSGVIDQPTRWTSDTHSFFRELEVDETQGLSGAEFAPALVDQGIKWAMALFPQSVDRTAFECTVLTNLAVASCESQSSVITQDQVLARDIRVLGIDLDWALDYVLNPLNTGQRKKFKQEYYWCMWLMLERQKAAPSSYYLAWCDTIRSSYRNYIRLRCIDGQFALAVVFYGCMLDRSSVQVDMRRLSAAVEANILVHDCTTRGKHRAENEINNVLNYLPRSADLVGDLLVRAGNIYNALYREPIRLDAEWMYAGSIQAMWMLRANNPRYRFIDELNAIATLADVPAPHTEMATWYQPDADMTRSGLGMPNRFDEP